MNLWGSALRPCQELQKNSGFSQNQRIGTPPYNTILPDGPSEMSADP